MCCCGDHIFACCFPVCFVASKKGCCGKECWLAWFLGCLCYLPSCIYACTFVGEPDIGETRQQQIVIQTTQPMPNQNPIIVQQQNVQQMGYPNHPMQDYRNQPINYPNQMGQDYRNQPINYPNQMGQDYRIQPMNYPNHPVQRNQSMNYSNQMGQDYRIQPINYPSHPVQRNQSLNYPNHMGQDYGHPRMDYPNNLVHDYRSAPMKPNHLDQNVGRTNVSSQPTKFSNPIDEYRSKLSPSQSPPPYPGHRNENLTKKATAPYPAPDY